MKVIAVFAAVLAVSSASPQFWYNGLGLHHGLTYSAAPAVVASAPAVVAAPAVHVPVATKTQYHAQDELGQASFGHSEPGQAHAAVRDASGGVSGTFSYISPEGIPFTTHYRADQNGYRVASNALPVAPAVAIAGPVDTPEVAAAKAQHAAAHAEALARSGRRKRGLVSTYNVTPYVHHSAAVVAAPAAVAYSAPAVVAAHHAPAVTYTAAAAPAVVTAHHTPAATVAYSAAPAVVAHHAPAVTYTAAAAPAVVAHAPAAVTYTAAAAPAVVAAPAVRAATLTKVVNTPGHAVSYRVD